MTSPRSPSLNDADAPYSLFGENCAIENCAITIYKDGDGEPDEFKITPDNIPIQPCGNCGSCGKAQLSQAAKVFLQTLFMVPKRCFEKPSVQRLGFLSLATAATGLSLNLTDIESLKIPLVYEGFSLVSWAISRAMSTNYQKQEYDKCTCPTGTGNCRGAESDYSDSDSDSD